MACVMTHLAAVTEGSQPASLITTQIRARNERLQQRTTTFVTRSRSSLARGPRAPSRGLQVRMSTLLVNQGPISAAPAGAARTRGRFEKDVTHRGVERVPRRVHARPP